MRNRAMTMLAMAAMSSGLWAATRHTPAMATIRIYYSFDPRVTTDRMLFEAARLKAADLLAKAGIRLEWREGTVMREQDSSRAIALRFIPYAPESFRTRETQFALAAAWPYAASTRIEMFQDRIGNLLAGFGVMNRPKVLAHVLAHEIVHVVEGVARHSNTGLMKAHWDFSDLDRMTIASLPLAEEDLLLLRDRLAPNTGSDATSLPADESGR